MQHIETKVYLVELIFLLIKKRKKMYFRPLKKNRKKSYRHPFDDDMIMTSHLLAWDHLPYTYQPLYICMHACCIIWKAYDHAYSLYI